MLPENAFFPDLKHTFSVTLYAFKFVSQWINRYVSNDRILWWVNAINLPLVILLHDLPLVNDIIGQPTPCQTYPVMQSWIVKFTLSYYLRLVSVGSNTDSHSPIQPISWFAVNFVYKFPPLMNKNCPTTDLLMRNIRWLRRSTFLTVTTKHNWRTCVQFTILNLMFHLKIVWAFEIGKTYMFCTFKCMICTLLLVCNEFAFVWKLRVYCFIVKSTAN